MKSTGSASVTRFLVPSLAALILGSVILWRIFFQPQGSEIRQIVLISIDTCRPDHLGCYGYTLDTTPNIDALAKKGILFENAVSPLPYTLPAHCTMLTGTTPPFHGVLDNSDYKLSPQIPSLATLLKGKGFSTAAFVSSFVLDSRFGMDQGFDLYDDTFEGTDNALGINQQRGDEATGKALAWLEEHQDEKKFMFLHYYDPHFTYDPPEPFASRFKNVPPIQQLATPIKKEFFDGYAGEIAYTDHCIGQVVEKLKQLNLYESSLIVVTSDHGEMLGQHGEVTHGYFVYEPAIKVPLVWKIPGHSTAIRMTDRVGIEDIAPTICAMLEMEMPSPIQGKDLSPCFEGKPLPYSERDVVCQSFEPTKYDASPLVGVVAEQFKYIRTVRPELYDLAKDPLELDNLASKSPDRLAEMEEILAEALADNTGQGRNHKAGMDGETRRRLESLGYVSGAIKETYDFNDLEDPKDLIEYHVRTMQIGYFIHEAQYSRAESLCQELISQRPSFFRPYMSLARIAMMQDKFSDAVGHLRKVIELKPDDVSAHEGLGEAYEGLGRFEQAAEHYAKTLKLMPDTVEVYYKLAKCLYELGDYRATDKFITDEMKANPSYVDAAISLANKLLERRQIRLAYEQYLSLLELDSDSVTVLNALAWLEAASPLSGLANPDQAVERAMQACDLTEYGTAEVVDTLAVAYAAAGRFSKAVETARKAIQVAQTEGHTALAQRIQKRLRLYQARRPYRDAALAQDAGQ